MDNAILRNAILQNRAIGQSTWLDYIRREMLATGELARLLKQGVTGLTSNPTIFEKAISGSADYDRALAQLAEAGNTPREAFEALSVEDIQGASDVLRAVYDDTGGADGYASIEVPPSLAHDTEETVREARRLFSLIRRPNVMIKVPATAEGVPAIRTLIADGINVNVTLIFGLDAYRSVIDAYMSGLDVLIASGKAAARVASVASFFVSRVDTAVDAQLRALPDGAGAGLTGTAAVANARMAYAIFNEEFGSERFAQLRESGARVQRPLWASTSTKDPALSDTFYVDSLVGPDTVNTMPPATLEAVIDHGASLDALHGTEASARASLEALHAAGVDMAEVASQLLSDGVASFAKSYDDLIAGIEAKCARLAQTVQR